MPNKQKQKKKSNLCKKRKCEHKHFSFVCNECGADMRRWFNQEKQDWEKEALEKVFNKLAFVGDRGQEYINKVVFPFIRQAINQAREEGYQQGKIDERENFVSIGFEEIRKAEIIAQQKERERVLGVVQKIDPVWLAECFHDFYESYAKLKGWNTQEKTKVPFADLPKENKETMICTASSVLMELQGKILNDLSTRLEN